jgi:hypothetical protein
MLEAGCAEAAAGLAPNLAALLAALPPQRRAPRLQALAAPLAAEGASWRLRAALAAQLGAAAACLDADVRPASALSAFAAYRGLRARVVLAMWLDADVIAHD